MIIHVKGTNMDIIKVNEPIKLFAKKPSDKHLIIYILSAYLSTFETHVHCDKLERSASSIGEHGTELR